MRIQKQLIFILFLSTLLILGACGTNLEGSENDSTSGSKENANVEENENNSENATPDDSEKRTETGIYNGQADPHTIEIETSEGPLAFQLTDEAREDVEELTIDEEVTYTYTEDGDTRLIESIKSNTEAKAEPVTETGIYNGQVDPHTIEIETKDGPLAFQLTDEARDDVEALTVDEEVTYTYTEDGDTRLIESIKSNTEAKAEPVTETGIYNGQADPHTIEIETVEGPIAFQLTDDARDDVETLTVDEEIMYSYTMDGDTRLIDSVQSNSDKITETGVYNGQADPHTIEIETAEGPLAFQLTVEARDDVEALTVDEEVTYTYTEGGNTRLIESVSPSK